MDFSLFHFAQPAWLWGGAAIPLVLALYAVLYRSAASQGRLERFADRHLLPHLIKSNAMGGRSIRLPLSLWALAWLCGIVAIAGPRWNYTDVQTFRASPDLVVVLDLSSTMNAQDVKPSRIARAREEISDLLNLNPGVSIGLVAYAAVPHMITPVTDDVRTIKALLPSLDPSLETLDGDRLKPALAMAARMLKAEPGNEKSILVLGDGGFEENDYGALARAAGGATIYTMGVGTAAGAPIRNESGDWSKDASGQLLISRLAADRLQKLAAAGGGIYVEANYTDSDTLAVLSHIQHSGDAVEAAHRGVRVWEERFYIPAIALALLLLPFFRKGAVFPVLLLVTFMLVAPQGAHAATLSDFFLNRDQQAQAAFNRRDYNGAIAKFDTPYRRGVAAYRAGAYEAAATAFKAAATQSGNTLNALYDLGNSQLMLSRPEDAIASYEAVLKLEPDNASARHNLAIAEKLLEKKHQDQAQSHQNQSKLGDKGSQKQDQQSAASPANGTNQSPTKGKQQSGESKQGTQAAQNSGSSPSATAQAKDQAGTGTSKQQEEAGQHQKSEPTPQEAARQNAGGADRSQGQQGGQTPAQPSTQASSAQAGQQPPMGNAAPPKPQPETPASNKTDGNQMPGNGHPLAALPSDKPQGPDVPAVETQAPRTQKDVDADEWLDRVQSDPGSFLKNQFAIEDRESSQQESSP